MAWAFTMEGVGGKLDVFEDAIVITPKGFMGLMQKGLKGSKTIPIASITAIQFKRSGLTSGYLQFTLPGGNESRGGVFAAIRDENSFTFQRQNDLATRIKEYIEARMKALRSAPATAMKDLAQELRTLADLREGGALSDEEFAAAKKRLLDL